MELENKTNAEEAKEKKEPTAAELQQQIEDFIVQQKTLMLSTSNGENMPLASYTPYICDSHGDFYIFISDMAEHSKNIRYALENQQSISIMLIADEQDSRNLFARKRLTYQCQVTFIAREESIWGERIELFQQRFGKIMQLLSQLGDFRLYCLKPGTGNFVLGFGKAYALENGSIQHITA